MRKTLLVVAALLLANTNYHVAAAAEKPERLLKESPRDAKEIRNSKKADKIIVMLGAIGISDPDITEFVKTVDARTDGGYFTLHEEKINHGSLKLRYAVQTKVGIKQFELRYAPENSNMEYTARTNEVMARYKLKF